MKATIVKRRRSHIHFWRKQMTLWLAGDHEGVWETAVRLEQKRKQKRRGRKRSHKPKSPEEALNRRVANLVNLGELRKAMSAMTSFGIANLDDDTVRQLQLQHPSRPRPTVFPTPDEIQEERNVLNPPQPQDSNASDKLRQLRANAEAKHDQHWPSMTIGAEAIEKAAMKARRTTSGGLQQITPWLLRRAILADTNHQTV